MTIDEIRHELLTQDNRITEHPIFMVQERRRLYGVGDGYTDLHVWVDGCGEVFLESEEDVSSYCEENGCEAESFERIGVAEIWVGVQPFLTAKGAEEYIATNGHRLDHPRIYVASAYRNPEWQLVRSAFMADESDSIAAARAEERERLEARIAELQESAELYRLLEIAVRYVGCTEPIGPRPVVLPSTAMVVKDLWKTRKDSWTWTHIWDVLNALTMRRAATAKEDPKPRPPNDDRRVGVRRSTNRSNLVGCFGRSMGTASSCASRTTTASSGS